jgi:hypothetical protein
LEGYGRSSLTYDRLGDVIDDEADAAAYYDGIEDNFCSAGLDDIVAADKANEALASRLWHWPVDWTDDNERELQMEMDTEWDRLSETEKADLRHEYRSQILGLNDHPLH